MLASLHSFSPCSLPSDVTYTLFLLHCLPLPVTIVLSPSFPRSCITPLPLSDIFSFPSLVSSSFYSALHLVLFNIMFMINFTFPSFLPSFLSIFPPFFFFLPAFLPSFFLPSLLPPSYHITLHDVFPSRQPRFPLRCVNLAQARQYRAADGQTAPERRITCRGIERDVRRPGWRRVHVQTTIKVAHVLT